MCVLVDSSCGLVVPGLKVEGVSEFKVEGFRVVNRLTGALVDDENVCDVGCKDAFGLCVVPRVVGCIDVSEVSTLVVRGFKVDSN